MNGLMVELLSSQLVRHAIWHVTGGNALARQFADILLIVKEDTPEATDPSFRVFSAAQVTNEVGNCLAFNAFFGSQ